MVIIVIVVIMVIVANMVVMLHIVNLGITTAIQGLLKSKS